LRHLTHCLSFLCVLTKIWCVKYAVTPLNGNAAAAVLLAGGSFRAMLASAGLSCLFIVRTIRLKLKKIWNAESV